MATVIPLPVKLRAPSPERAAELFKAADELWPEYEAEREAEERDLLVATKRSKPATKRSKLALRVVR